MNHTTHSIIMVPPNDFCFNEQTGEDNEFQHPPDLTPEMLKEDAMAEFNQMVNILRDNFIEVLLLNKNAKLPALPDAVFPNNWFSTDSDGFITLYPMKTLNRQAEIRPVELQNLLATEGYNINGLDSIEAQDSFLEGTGSIIFDHKHMTAYAAISDRCDKVLFEKTCLEKGYRAISFTTQSSSNRPIYHTNVMMSVGEGFAVICTDSITSNKQEVLNSLKQNHKQRIDISLEQAEKYFCANILQLRNERNELVIVMSDNAYRGFSKEQKNQLSLYGKLIPCPIDTIESVGGGSARCMIAENFLPKA